VAPRAARGCSKLKVRIPENALVLAQAASLDFLCVQEGPDDETYEGAGSVFQASWFSGLFMSTRKIPALNRSQITSPSR
jgi:hypothetical protein